MDFTEGSMAIALISVSIAILKLNRGGKIKNENNYKSGKVDVVQLQKDLSERPTFKDIEGKYVDSKLCKIVHEQIKEKLDCLPTIKTNLIKIMTKMKIKEDG